MTQRIKILKPTIIAGTYYNLGDFVEVENNDAHTLIELGAGKIVTATPNKMMTPEKPKKGYKVKG